MQQHEIYETNTIMCMGLLKTIDNQSFSSALLAVIIERIPR